jgi:outer membrane protein TolC
MKRIENAFCLLIIILLIVPGKLIAQETETILNLTFQDALSRTVRENLTIKQVSDLVSQKEYELKASRALYLPKISMGANYVYMSDDIHLDLSPVRDAITPLYEALGNYGNFSGIANPDPSTSGVLPILPDNISTSLVRTDLLNGLDDINAADWNQIIQKKQFGVITAGFTQPIFMGGKIILANQAAKIYVEEAEIQKKEQYSMVFNELVERYYALVLSKQVKQVRQQVYNTMLAHLNDAEQMMDEGIIANAEYLHAKVYLSESDRELKKASRQVEIVNEALLNTLAIDNLVWVEPISNLFYTNELEPLNYYLESAEENSPLLQQIDKKIALADKALKANKADYLPNIAAMGTYDIANKDLSSMIPDYMVGIGVQWNIFEGVSRVHKVKAAKYQMQQVETFSQKANADIESAVIKQYQELNMNLEQLEELESALQFANEYCRVQEFALSEGMATTIEVADANLLLAKIKIEQLSVVYQFDIALSKLFYYAGITDSFNSFQLKPTTIYLSI